MDTQRRNLFVAAAAAAAIPAVARAAPSPITPAMVEGQIKAWAAAYTANDADAVARVEPPANGFTYDYPQDQIDALPSRALASPADAAGSATIEGYSVMHDRDGNPERIIASCLLADCRRAWGDSTDASLGRDMCTKEFVGTTVTLDAEGVLHAS